MFPIELGEQSSHFHFKNNGSSIAIRTIRGLHYQYKKERVISCDRKY
jgi:hypothetical protein